MKKHTKIYLTAMGYDESDWIGCEVINCEAQCNDIHHIERRGMGGTKRADTIENLMAVCRYHHDRYGDRKDHKEYLKFCHFIVMKKRNVKFNPKLLA